MFKKITKIVFVNLIVMIIFLIIANLLSGGILKIYPSVRAKLTTLVDTNYQKDVDGKIVNTLGSNRWRLPNYTDKEYAYKIFAEFGKLKTKYQAFTGWSRLPFKGETTTIDQDGNRVHHHTNGAKEVSIAWFFGGSTMWGTGTDDNGTIAAIFDEINPNFQTINYGETGFNSRQELAHLVNLYSQGKRPDLVVFYDGVNDVGTLCRREIKVPGHSREQLIRKEMSSGSRYWAALQIVLVEYTKTFLYKLRKKLFPVASHKDKYLCSCDPSRAELVASQLVNNWRIAHNLVESFGGTFIGILQPVAYIGHARIDHVKQDMEHPGRSGLSAQYEALYPLIRKKIKKYDFMFDMTQAYNGDVYIYADFCHVSRNGNEIIANMINKIIVNNIINNPSTLAIFDQH